MVSYGTLVSFDEGKFSTTVAMVGPTWIPNSSSIIHALIFLDWFLLRMKWKSLGPNFQKLLQ
jgi:hypothetical protein